LIALFSARVSWVRGTGTMEASRVCPPRRDLADVIVAGKPDAAETAPHRNIDLIGAGIRDITDGQKG
jgi:hypothetical protein